ncbi:hypothetical protein [Kingella potus]|uniref:hypothetical protein n=1 Tax=Kingella potus TaxID=265175 RepID=UPI001FD1C8E2|nr:hypothetical protein [Kingella potus]UOP01547.1 hypothetical protein LVJ84_04980 [Kingella potus]
MYQAAHFTAECFGFVEAVFSDGLKGGGFRLRNARNAWPGRERPSENGVRTASKAKFAIIRRIFPAHPNPSCSNA